ncbi:hypothetical protein R6Q59_027446 [Mikania micrantha]
MASSRSAQSFVGIGASSSTEPIVVRIKTTTRNKDLFQPFDLCEMSNGVDKACCKGCSTFLKPESNSTLRSHLTKHFVIVKNNPGNDQSQMSTKCGVWNFIPGMVSIKHSQMSTGNVTSNKIKTFEILSRNTDRFYLCDDVKHMF